LGIHRERRKGGEATRTPFPMGRGEGGGKKDNIYFSSISVGKRSKGRGGEGEEGIVASFYLSSIDDLLLLPIKTRKKGEKGPTRSTLLFIAGEKNEEKKSGARFMRPSPTFTRRGEEGAMSYHILFFSRHRGGKRGK